METKKFIYYKDGDMWIGWLEEYPDYRTQGETLARVGGESQGHLRSPKWRRHTVCSPSWGAARRMKRVDLVREKSKKWAASLYAMAGGRHDWYLNPTTKAAQPAARHREIKDSLAKHILEIC